MTYAEFIAYFTEFSSLDTAQYDRAYDIAFATLNEDIIGENYELALKYLTAHFVTINANQFSGNGSSTKRIASRSVDGVSISYENNYNGDMSSGMLSTTSYGIVYIRLVNGLSAGGFTAC